MAIVFAGRDEVVEETENFRHVLDRGRRVVELQEVERVDLQVGETHLRPLRKVRH
jgi:hypothetical protein